MCMLMETIHKKEIAERCSWLYERAQVEELVFNKGNSSTAMVKEGKDTDAGYSVMTMVEI